MQFTIQYLLYHIQAPKAFNLFHAQLTEHEITTAHEAKMLEKILLAFKRSDGVFIMLINVKMPTIVGFLAHLSRRLRGELLVYQ